MTSSPGSLAERYAHRLADARGLATNGATVIGIVGADVPRALVEASGAIPFRLFGDEASDVTRAAEILGRSVDVGTARILAGILDGDFDFLRGILISHDCQASVLLFYSLRELSRSGEIAVPIHLVDLVHLDREPTLDFDVAQLRRMTEVLGAWTGSPATGQTLRTAMLAARRVHDGLREIQRLRQNPTSSIRGVDALHAFGVASALPAEAARDVLATVAAASITVDDGSALRLFFTGSSPLGDSMYRAIEARNVVIVGEDHDWGELVLSVSPPEPDPDASLENLLHSLATALLRSAPAAATSGQFARGRAIRTAVESSDARAVLSVVRERDEAPAWDFPRQRLEAAVPAVLLDRHPAELSRTGLAVLADAVDRLRDM